jgi:hypothetical protein
MSVPAKERHNTQNQDLQIWLIYDINRCQPTGPEVAYPLRFVLSPGIHRVPNCTSRASVCETNAPANHMRPGSHRPIALTPFLC